MKHIVLFAVLVMALAMTGAGCTKRDAQPVAPDAAVEQEKDAGTQVADSGVPSVDAGTLPVGWQVFQSGTVKIAYPPAWHAVQVQLSADHSPTDLVRIIIDPKPIPQELPQEPFFSVTAEVYSGSLDDAVATIPAGVSRSVIRIDGRDVVYAQYVSEYPDGSITVYIGQKGDKIFALHALDVSQEILSRIVVTFFQS